MTTSEIVPLTPFAQHTKDGDDAHRRLTIYGEPTAVPELFITPSRARDGRYTGSFALTHIHTGRAVRTGEPYLLRDIAERCVGLDWTFGRVEDFPKATAQGAAAAIRDAAATRPTAQEQPVVESWAAGRSPSRSALALAVQMLETFQWSWDRTVGKDATVSPSLPDPEQSGKVVRNPEWDHHIATEVNTYGLALLLLTLHRDNPALADSVAAGLADAWDAGDSLGEWVYEWRQQLADGRPVTLPGVPDVGDDGDLVQAPTR